MLRSMTGFGRCLVENANLTQQWEVKSVNGRHLDLKWRLPVAVRSLEPRLEKVVRRFASRGRVDISLILQYAAADFLSVGRHRRRAGRKRRRPAGGRSGPGPGGLE